MTSSTVSHGLAGHPAPAPVSVRVLRPADIWQALVAGFNDMRRSRTDALTIAVIYPIAAVFLATVIVLRNFLPLVFPVCAGFALLGPMATLWYVAQSRRLERGDESALAVFTPERLVAIQRLCAIAMLLFVAWNVAAGIIYGLTLGSANEAVGAPFLYRVFHTEAGLALIFIGCGTGAVLAVSALAVFFISFPLVLDRPVSATQAIAVSVRAILRNPFLALGWGVLVVAGLAVGAIPALIGIVIVLPTLGHASWHLYRRLVV